MYRDVRATGLSSARSAGRRDERQHVARPNVGRELGFVVGRREGRDVVYDLPGDHVAKLLDPAVSHVEHVQLGLAGRAEQPDRVEASV
jgi:hypothetical protein